VDVRLDLSLLRKKFVNALKTFLADYWDLRGRKRNTRQEKIHTCNHRQMLVGQ